MSQVKLATGNLPWRSRRGGRDWFLCIWWTGTFESMTCPFSRWLDGGSLGSCWTHLKKPKENHKPVVGRPNYWESWNKWAIPPRWIPQTSALSLHFRVMHDPLVLAVESPFTNQKYIFTAFYSAKPWIDKPLGCFTWVGNHWEPF